MSKIFTCDNCAKQFPQPLDEEKYRDEHGEWQTYDLCAPCRKELQLERSKPIKSFMDKIKKKIK